MFLDLFAACKNGNKDACERLYFIYWLSPRLEKMLKKLSGGVAIAPLLLPPIPGPDPGPEIDAGFLRERAVVQAVLGDPNPQPNIFPREVRLKATITLRDGLTKMVESLNADIETLGREKQKK
jgi:hypothetical protein